MIDKWQSSTIPKLFVAKLVLYFDNFLILPPLNPVKEIILIFFLFASFAHFKIFLLEPETENKSKISFGFPNLASWYENISS